MLTVTSSRTLGLFPDSLLVLNPVPVTEVTTLVRYHISAKQVDVGEEVGVGEIPGPQEPSGFCPCQKIELIRA